MNDEIGVLVMPDYSRKHISIKKKAVSVLVGFTWCGQEKTAISVSNLQEELSKTAVILIK